MSNPLTTNDFLHTHLMDNVKLNTFRKVNDALLAVNEARINARPGTPAAKLLDKAAVQLEKLSWQILSEDILAMAEEINRNSVDLKKLAAKINQSTIDLQAVANKIQKAAEVVKVLTDILTKAATAGLL